MTLKPINTKLSMRNLILVLTFLLPLFMFGQKTIKSDSKKEPIESYQTFEEYCLENAISFLTIPTEKQESVVYAGELKYIDSKNQVSYKDYGVEIKENENQYFKLTGSDKTLVVQSMYVLRLNYANSKK